MQRASGGRDFENVGLARLTWINLRNPEIRNATIGALEKQDLEAFKRWHDRPFQPKLKKLQQARSQDYRDAYSRFQAYRSDLIARQQNERRELQSMWRRIPRENSGHARSNERPTDREGTGALVELRARMQGNPAKNQAHLAALTKEALSRAERPTEVQQSGSNAQSKAKDALSALHSRSHRTHDSRSEERER